MKESTPRYRRLRSSNCSAEPEAYNYAAVGRKIDSDESHWSLDSGVDSSVLCSSIDIGIIHFIRSDIPVTGNASYRIASGCCKRKKRKRKVGCKSKSTFGGSAFHFSTFEETIKAWRLWKYEHFLLESRGLLPPQRLIALPAVVSSLSSGRIFSKV